METTYARWHPIRVLHVFGRLERHGAELRTLEIMRRLDPREFQLDFCVLSGRSGALDAEVERLGAVVHLLPLNAHFPVQFVRLLRARRYDAVHSHVHLSSGAILSLAALSGIRGRIAHLRSTHDGKPAGTRRLLQRALSTALVRVSATAIVGVCEGVLDHAFGPRWRHDRRCRAIYNGIDGHRFQTSVDRAAVRTELGIDAAARLYLHVGRVSPPKNHRRLLEIFAAIRRRTPAAVLLLVGGGTDDGSLKRWIGELNLLDSVVIGGERDDVPALMQAADLLLLPSLWEGLPGVVLEACAAGLPVLASDLPGVREIGTRLGLVRPLPLAAGDTEWARVALAITEAHGNGRREGPLEEFRDSVFQIERAVEAHCALWRATSSGVNS